MKENSHSIFNEQGLYAVPPEGLWVKDLIDLTTTNRTGPIFLPPGTIIAGDPDNLVK